MTNTPKDSVLTALLKAAERVGESSRTEYMSQVKRDRKGRVVKTYSLNEPHKRVMDTIDAYSRGKLSDDDAMSVLHEYEVLHKRI